MTKSSFCCFRRLHFPKLCLFSHLNANPFWKSTFKFIYIVVKIINIVNTIPAGVIFEQKSGCFLLKLLNLNKRFGKNLLNICSTMSIEFRGSFINMRSAILLLFSNPFFIFSKIAKYGHTGKIMRSV